MKIVLTWRLVLFGYIIPMVLISVGVIGYIWRVEELRQARLEDTARTDVLVCERAQTNASINLAQNERLAALLEAQLQSRKRSGVQSNGFEVAVAEAKIAIDQENSDLRKIALTNCKTLPSQRGVKR